MPPSANPPRLQPRKDPIISAPIPPPTREPPLTAPSAFVIGSPIAHSRSPLLHGFWLETLAVPGRYQAIEVLPDDLPRFIAGFRAAGFVGGNVTIPHKQAVFASVDRVEPEAAAIGAVNTVWLEGDTLVGGNTDAYGFLANLDEGAPGWDTPAGLAMVLGAGGGARAIVYGLLQRGWQVHVANRTEATAEALAAEFGPSVTGGNWTSICELLPRADLLVNATALGMVGRGPLSLDLAPLRPGAVVCDIVYVPLVTPLLRDAAARGHRVVDGLGMLLHQAASGFAHWFGRIPSVTPALRARLVADIEAGARR
jgi:shikimate dehydrogenase